MVLILTREDVMSVLSMKDCMDVVEKAFAELTNGTAVLPLRIGIRPPDGLSLYMPAYLKGMNALACKVVSVYKDNPAKHNLPTTIGKVLLQEPTTGEVVCIMDGGYLTAVRTGAASGVATKHLARKDSGQVAAVFGAGVQAKMQLWAVKEARDLSSALVFDTFPDAAVKFSKEMGEKLGITIKVAKDTAEMLSADIICTATSSSTPIFDGNKVREGTHLNGIGSHSPNARELDTAIIKRSLIIADSREACLNEAGDIMIPIQEGAITKEHIHADLGEIVTKKAKGRTDGRQITLFKSNGLAIQDAAAAKLVFTRAKEKGIGKEVAL
ncbi:MAG: ornithine cyclodeaminase family protein [Candidatus Thermoplasmatota archaeon]|jgi:ornithine cyclodeaminase/alanine dehydrogenase|nr:ornithine cyclodeaminase family protein [Candidatus Thermoplasmatota archaeon]